MQRCKVRYSTKLLRDKEVITQGPATKLPQSPLALVDGIGSMTEAGGVQRGTRAPGRLATPAAVADCHWLRLASRFHEAGCPASDQESRKCL
jgi:hypothetical protein